MKKQKLAAGFLALTMAAGVSTLYVSDTSSEASTESATVSQEEQTETEVSETETAKQTNIGYRRYGNSRGAVG